MLLKSGDTMAGAGRFSNAFHMAVANDGTWATDVAGSGGDVVLRNGQAIGPVGTGNPTLGVSVNNAGHVAATTFVPGNYPGTVGDRNTELYDGPSP